MINMICYHFYDKKLNIPFSLIVLILALLLSGCGDYQHLNVKQLNKHPRQLSIQLVTPKWNALWCDRKGESCVVIGEAGSIKQSEDGGKTWQVINSGTQYELKTIHEVNKGLLVFGEREAGGIKYREKVIILSEDGGKSWKTKISDKTYLARESILIHSNGEKLVTISSSDNIWQSNDGGVNWEASPDISGDFWLNALYGEGDRLVAVGQEGAIIRSIDHGKTWTYEKSPSQSNLIGIHRIGNYLVAVNDNGSILRSNVDGIDWGKNWMTVPDPSMLIGIHRIGNNFVVVDDNGSILRSNVDGINWGKNWMTVPDPSMDNYCRLEKVIKVDQALVAIGCRGTILRLKEGDEQWTKLPSQTEGDLSDIHNIGSELVVIGKDEQRKKSIILYSEDGKIFTKHMASDSMNRIKAIRVLGEGKLLAIGEQGEIFRSENKGKIWQTVNFSTNTPLTAIHGEENQLIAGGGALGDAEEIIRSDDGGETWTKVFSGSDDFKVTGIYGSGKQWVAIKNSHPYILQSNGDGKSWQPITDPPQKGLNAFNHVGKRLVAVGEEGLIMRSDNLGINWETVKSSGTEESLRAVHGEKNNWVAVGRNGSIVYSENHGKNWTAPPYKSDARLNAIYGVGKQWIAVGGHEVRPNDEPRVSEIISSDDSGKTWQKVSNEIRGELLAVRGNGKWWVAVGKKADRLVGYSGVIALSEDAGKTWTNITIPSLAWLGHIHADGQSLVAVGGSGTILRSEDMGKSWKKIPSGIRSPLRAIHGTSEQLVAVGGAEGDGAVVVIKPNGKLWPVLAKVSYRSEPEIGGAISLRFNIHDQDNLCEKPGNCILKVWGRDNTANKTLSSIQTSLTTTNNVWEAKVFPKDFAVNLGEELHLEILLEGPDFSLHYPNANSDDDIAIDYQLNRLTYSYFLIIALGSVATLLTLLYWLKPLWLLSLYRRLSFFEAAKKLSIPGLSDGVQMALKIFVLPWLITRSRIQDAWVKKNLDAWRTVFEQEEAVARLRYYPLPLRRFAKSNAQETILSPSPGDFVPDFSTSYVLLQIIGDGGSGKTSFAVQLGRWGLERRLTRHIVIPVWLDEEVTEIRPWLIRRVREVVRDDDLPEVFIQALFKGKRFLLVVDRLSERQAASHEAMKHLPAYLSAVIFTTRYEINLGLPDVKYIRTLGLSSKTVMGFLEDVIENEGVADNFSGLSSKADLVKRFADVITINDKEETITPLLVTLFVKKTIIQLDATQGYISDTLPTSIPDVYFEYLCSINPEDETVKNYVPKEKMLLAAGILACAELGESFRPNRIGRQEAEKALAKENSLGNGANIIQRLIDNHVLEEHQVGGDFKISFALDPVAEYLAAFACAKRCGKDTKAWKKLLENVAQRGEEAKGFMNALRITYHVYAESNGWARSITFPKSFTRDD